MKFIFSKSILTIYQASVESVASELGATSFKSSLSVDDLVRWQCEQTKGLKHVSVTEADGEVTYEVSDDVFVCYLGLCLKLARAFVPVFKAFAGLSDDVKSLVAMINERK